MIDLCTVVFREEIQTLQLQARSVSLYCNNIGIQSIYIIVNDNNEIADLIDPAWWGNLKSLVRVIPRSTFSTEYVSNGWVSQQVLKLLAAAISNNKLCMALDAKTFFVNPFPIDSFIDSQKRIAVGSMPIMPVFERSAEIAGKLWNIDVQRQLGPAGVPFFFDPVQVRAMIVDIERRTHQSFPLWFQSQGMLTEFILYSAWLEFQIGIDNAVTSGIIAPVNLCHSDLAQADNKLKFMAHPHTLTVSVHRNAWTKLSPEQQQNYTNLLTSKGIQ